MSAVNAGGEALASYTYDAFGQRLLKNFSGRTAEIYQHGPKGMLLLVATIEGPHLLLQREACKTAETVASFVTYALLRTMKHPATNNAASAAEGGPTRHPQMGCCR